MNSFEYGKTLPDSSFQFQVNNWNHYPIQPLDIYKYKVACHRRSKRANKPLLRYVFPGWPQNFGRVAFSSSFPFAFHWFNPVSNQLRNFVTNEQMSRNMGFWRTFVASNTTFVIFFTNSSLDEWCLTVHVGVVLDTNMASIPEVVSISCGRCPQYRGFR